MSNLVQNVTQKFLPQRLLSYVIANDNGLAPNITGGVCTLAVCKPVLRRMAIAGADWVVGFSTRWHGETRMIFAMQVDKKIGFSAYFNDENFESKKPIYEARGDNFYEPDPKHEGRYRVAFKQAAHYRKSAKIKSQSTGPYVLIGERFWYFGANAPKVPTPILKGTALAVPGEGRRGHRITDDSAKIRSFVAWIEQFPEGVHGQPRDVVFPKKQHTPKADILAVSALKM